MYNWTGRDLPGDWGKLREQRRHLAGGRCEAMSQIDPDGSQHMFGTRCVRVGTECDHHEGRDDHSIENLRWLCLHPSSPVLTPSGWRAISGLEVGDRVTDRWGANQRVTRLHRRHYEGELVAARGALLTVEHPVLTPDGWLPASALNPSTQVWMPRLEVFGMGGAEDQILRRIVGSISIKVVNALLWLKPPAKNLLHDEPVLHHQPSASDVNPHVATRSDGSVGRLSLRPGQGVEPSQSTLVGTRLGLPLAGEGAELFTAGDAGDEPTLALESLPGDEPTLVGAGEGRLSLDGKVGRTAYRAGGLHEGGALSGGGWYALGEVGRVPYSGYVHDITITGSHSYVTGMLTVHNCSLHHRAKTQAESAAARTRRPPPRRPPEPHPSRW